MTESIHYTSRIIPSHEEEPAEALLLSIPESSAYYGQHIELYFDTAEQRDHAKQW